MKVLDKKEYVIAEGDGLWTRYLQFDQKVYWRVGDAVMSVIPDLASKSLPSSCTRRKEL